MIQTGVTSTGCLRNARRTRSFFSAGRGSIRGASYPAAATAVKARGCGAPAVLIQWAATTSHAGPCRPPLVFRRARPADGFPGGATRRNRDPRVRPGAETREIHEETTDGQKTRLGRPTAVGAGRRACPDRGAAAAGRRPLDRAGDRRPDPRDRRRPLASSRRPTRPTRGDPELRGGRGRG